MTKVIDLIYDTRRHLLASYRPTLNRLTFDLTVDATVITLDFVTDRIGAGSMVGINDELLYVWSVGTTAKSLIVQRGMLGTVAKAASAGDLVEINPRYPQAAIRKALQQEIQSYKPALFRTESVTYGAGVSSVAIDLDGAPTDWLYIIDVLKSPATGGTRWSRVEGRYEKDLDPADFGGGEALFLNNAPDQTSTLRVKFAVPFDAEDMSDGVSCEDDIGMATSQTDIPPYGAAWRLVSGKDALRVDTSQQPEPRLAAEVPPGTAMGVAKGFKEIRDARLGKEAIDLLARHPIRF